jgi:hypothetical protein
MVIARGEVDEKRLGVEGKPVPERPVKEGPSYFDLSV